jgi:hypothetical protein
MQRGEVAAVGVASFHHSHGLAIDALFQFAQIGTFGDDTSRAQVDHRRRYHGAAMRTEAVRFLVLWMADSIQSPAWVAASSAMAVAPGTACARARRR